MPMETIDAHLITQFSDRMHVVAQQTKARMRAYTEIVPIKGDNYAYDSLGDLEARELTGRFNKIEWADAQFTRRKMVRRRFEVTVPLDDYDIEGMMSDPSSPLASACVRAMERVYDRVVYSAMFADVQVGRNFENTITAAQDGVLTVNATGGITLPLLLTPRQNFINNEVGNDEDVPIVFGITGTEHTQMLQLTTITSRDYSSQMALDKGVLTNVVGMNVVKFGANARKPVMTVNAGTRTCFVMAQGGVVVGMGRNWRVKVQDRVDYVDTKQIQVTGVLGAVRTEGKLIQAFTTTA